MLTSSDGTCAAFIPGAPTCKTPNKKAAKRIPIGEFPASKLTAIPLNPIANGVPCTK